MPDTSSFRELFQTLLALFESFSRCYEILYLMIFFVVLLWWFVVILAVYHHTCSQVLITTELVILKLLNRIWSLNPYLLLEAILWANRNFRTHSNHVRVFSRFLSIVSMIKTRHRFSLAQPLFEFVIDTVIIYHVVIQIWFYECSASVVADLLLSFGALSSQESWSIILFYSILIHLISAV